MTYTLELNDDSLGLTFRIIERIKQEYSNGTFPLSIHDRVTFDGILLSINQLKDQAMAEQKKQ